MVRQTLKEREKQEGFRLRGMDHTRIEGLSDGVFAIAIALLLISADVPEKFSELKEFLKDFVPFGATITLLMVIWYQHYLFFIRYGLKDAFTVFLNTILLFMILFYVYPLKFLFKTLFTLFSSLITRDFDTINLLFTETISLAEAPLLMIIYGIGAASIFASLALLNFYALRKKDELELTDLEVFDTKSVIGTNLVLASVPVLSALVAIFRIGGDDTFTISGWTYFLYPFIMPVYSIFRQKVKKRIYEME